MNQPNDNKKSSLWMVAVVLGVVLFSGGMFYVAQRMGIIPKDFWMTVGGGPKGPSQEAQEMAARINYHRIQAGLQPAELDDDMSDNCQKHVDYLVRNRSRLGPISLAYHTQNPEYPGYSQEGLAAANSSVIAFNQSPPGAVDAWMATLYHRLP